MTHLNSLVITFLFLFSLSTTASTTRIDFSGVLSYGTISNYGNFSGVLLADWDTGTVYDYYADVSYSTGQNERYSIFQNYDNVTVNQGTTSKQYWSDETTKQYDLSLANTGFTVSRYHRDQNEKISVGPDPDWEMTLEIIPRGIWAWSDDKYNLVSCGTRYCWEQESAFNVFGTITELTTSIPQPSTVPIPAAAWLFGSALLGFFGFSRRKAKV